MMTREEFCNKWNYTDSTEMDDSNIGCRKIPKDCLSCASSSSEEGDEGGDILHCDYMPVFDDTVEEGKVCEMWG
jgi:hypothetical protein